MERCGRGTAPQIVRTVLKMRLHLSDKESAQMTWETIFSAKNTSSLTVEAKAKAKAATCLCQFSYGSKVTPTRLEDSLFSRTRSFMTKG